MFAKLKLYIHVATINNWENVLSELLDYVKTAELDKYADITLVSVGENIASTYRVVNTGLPVEHYEFPTLKLLQEELEENTAVGYCHVKGVSQPHSWHHVVWRREMADFILTHWRTRINHLLVMHTSGPRITNSGVGIGLEHCSAYKHYSGNFWWARSDYLKLLPKVQHNTNRYAAETWIGQSPLINEEIPIDTSNLRSGSKCRTE